MKFVEWRDWILTGLVCFTAWLIWSSIQDLTGAMDALSKKIEVLVVESVYSKNQVEDHERRIRDLEREASRYGRRSPRESP